MRQIRDFPLCEVFNSLEQMLESTTTPSTDWIPVVSYDKQGEENIIQVDIPGVKKENVTIVIDDSIMTVSGYRKLSDEKSNHFKKNFSVYAGLKSDDIKAKMEDGVLTITIPLVSPNKIKVDIE